MARNPRSEYTAPPSVDELPFPLRTVLQIETFPETVYNEVPTVRRYRYFRNDNDVILVDPDENRVVDVFE